MAITNEKAGKPKTNQDTFNEATLKDMCGKVTDQIKQYFCSNCECVTEYEPDTIKQMMQKHKQSIKLYKELSTVVTKLGDELIKSPKDFMLSVKRACYAKTTSTQFVEYPMRVDQDPPIVVLGPHGTEVPETRYSKIRWNTPQGAARMLCALVFDRNTILMTNFSDTILDPYKVSDIEYCIKANTKATSEEIHKAIAKKCHDTHVKFMKYRLSHGIEF
ncbi:early boundary activity protein 1-like [Rhagoletis pomonella]|uniref:early boundary activity protein 1-like n=1 Tax=Rhagoletis pomonella TaxID=28610 RepID=UPI00177F2F68|nr:early boundary activity protein 1-like [Rhagoletis pomonella]